MSYLSHISAKYPNPQFIYPNASDDAYLLVDLDEQSKNFAIYSLSDISNELIKLQSTL